MNKHTSHLGRLFDEAAAHYNPQPDVARLERMLLGSGQQSHRRRTGLVVWSAAACFALIGGTTFAFNQQSDDDHRLAPAHSQEDGESDSTAVKTTERRPDKTLPDGGHDPIDKTTLPTLPKPTDPPTTERKEQPKSTEPNNTEPKDTEPPKPPEGKHEWSVHQVYFTGDSEPPFEVFWGTANVGDKITVVSDYGSAQVFANENGDWEVRVYFEGAPVGVPFQIWVYGAFNEAVFSFTYLG